MHKNICSAKWVQNHSWRSTLKIDINFGIQSSCAVLFEVYSIVYDVPWMTFLGFVTLLLRIRRGYGDAPPPSRLPGPWADKGEVIWMGQLLRAVGGREESAW